MLPQNLIKAIIQRFLVANAINYNAYKLRIDVEACRSRLYITCQSRHYIIILLIKSTVIKITVGLLKKWISFVVLVILFSF